MEKLERTMIKCWRETRWKKRATFIPSCARQTTSKITRNGIMFCQCRISVHHSLNTVMLPKKKCFLSFILIFFDFCLELSLRLGQPPVRASVAPPPSPPSPPPPPPASPQTSWTPPPCHTSYPNYMHSSSPMVRSNIHNVIAAVFFSFLNYIRMKWVHNSINTGHCW